MKKIQEEKKRILQILYNIKEMDLSPKQERRYKAASTCHICKKRVQRLKNPDGHKVRDHCHFTGKSLVFETMSKSLK